MKSKKEQVYPANFSIFCPKQRKNSKKVKKGWGRNKNLEHFNTPTYALSWYMQLQSEHAQFNRTYYLLIDKPRPNSSLARLVGTIIPLKKNKE